VRRVGVLLSAAAVTAVVSGAALPAAPGDAERCSTPSDTVAREVPWPQRRLALDRVWELTTGTGVVVGVVDTGVDASVPQLRGRVLSGIDVVNGRGRADSDCYGHGTFVAGIIAAERRAGTGFAGVAPGATILPVRQATGPSDGSSAGLARSIRAAVDGGARVINVSASAFFPNGELRAAVDYATANDVVLVAAASNEAKSGNPKAYPAAYPEVIAVGAVGQDGRRTEFSEVGDFLDLVAPGADVISLSRASAGHLSDNGTSYATPFVAGTAALVRAYHPRLTAAQVKRRLELTADHPGTALPDPQVGWGIVNPYHALTAVLPEEFGAQGAPVGQERVVARAWSPPDTGPRDTAVRFAVGAGLVAVIGGLLAYVLPRGARRGWRPAGEDDGDKAGQA
jgi:membrane-anchored mycosin MYCP